MLLEEVRAEAFPHLRFEVQINHATSQWLDFDKALQCLKEHKPFVTAQGRLDDAELSGIVPLSAHSSLTQACHMELFECMGCRHFYVDLRPLHH